MPTESNFADLKIATRELISRCNGIESSALVDGCRVGKSNISRYQSKGDREIFIPIDVLLALELDCGDPVITKTLARLNGYEMFQLPDAVGSRGPIHKQLLKVFKESGDVFTQGAKALEDDNHVSPVEAQALLKETNEALIAFIALQRLLQKRIQVGILEQTATIA
ncbi:phage regulatory CII family protein [Hyphobacterium sp.]|jgi:hypothetical protein|uniref:phage regulatory CII family protein n=1 Tax=Hyphobacterium sp. TaxID=2004662 RepID=UPI003BABB394